MAAPLRLSLFGGTTPRLGPRLLPEGGAQIATNCLLTSGEIAPFRGLELIETPSVPGPWMTVHRAEYGETEHWLAWTKDVDIAIAPLPADVEPRYYVTGDGEPRFAPFSNLPTTFFALGIPGPKAAPTVNHSGGTGATISRVYGYTFFSALGEESAMSPASALTNGKPDGTWAVTAMDAFPASAGTGTVSVAAGVTSFTNTGNHWLRPGDEVVISSTKVVVVETPTNTSFKVAGDFAGATAWARVAAWNTAGMKRRLYRSAGTTASYQLVHDDVGTSYNDTLSDSAIMGDELISATWALPPTGLKGIFALPNGSLCGFYKNKLRLSEPYQPHAWPIENEYSTDYEVVGAQSFGSTVVACTAANPYVFDGQDPGAMSGQKIDQVWPCLSKRSVAAVGDGVVYATAFGLAYVGLAGSRIFTKDLYTKQEWSPLEPSTMITAVSEGRIHIAYTRAGGAPSMLVIDPGEMAVLTEMAVSSTELYADPRNGLLYIVDDSGIKQWDAVNGTFLSYTWRSKEIELPFPRNFGAAKIDFISASKSADQSQAQANFNVIVAANQVRIDNKAFAGAYGSYAFGALPINGTDLTPPPPVEGLDRLSFLLVADGVERVSKQIFSNEPFRLPAGFKADNVAVQVSGTVKIRSIKLAETIVGLKQT